MHMGHKGCGHWGKEKGMKGDWDREYEKMDPKEKKEMLEKKVEHLQEKMDWARGELSKLNQ